MDALDSFQGSTVEIFVAFLCVGVVSVLLLYYIKRSFGAQEQLQESDNNDTESPQTNGTHADGEKHKKSPKAKYTKPKEKPFEHDYLASNLKGHTDSITDVDFSSNGKYLLSCAEDRSCFLWSTKQLHQKDHRFIKGAVEHDHATRIYFSPDNRAFIVSLAVQNTIRVFKMSRKDDGSLGNVEAVNDFPKVHKKEIIGIGISCTSPFVMTGDAGTTIKIWSVKGDALSTIDTGLMTNYCVVLSRCGRFVAASGFAPDVKVWEVQFDKSGQFREVTRAFELKGHSAGIRSFDFNGDSTRMVSISKDYTWKFWNTNVHYRQGQDPVLLFTCPYSSAAAAGPAGASPSCHIAVAPDSRAVALALGASLRLYALERDYGGAAGGANAQGAGLGGGAAGDLSRPPDVEIIVEDVHLDEIRVVRFDTRSRFIVTAGGDRHIRVFHNRPGLRALVAVLSERRRTATTKAQRELLDQQIGEAQTTLDECTSTKKEPTMT